MTVSRPPASAHIETPVTISQAEVYYSPRGGATDAVVREITAATKSLSVLAYSFTSKPIAAALIAAHRRGVKIEIVLDKSQRNEKTSQSDEVRAAGIALWFDTTHAIMHDKVCIADEAVVVTGSFNYSAAAENENAENLLVLRSPELAARYLENFRVLRDAAEKAP